MKAMRVVFILLLLISIGSYLRFTTISPFKFYPDAYQNLIVAENISDYQSVFGLLGNEGMPYPYFLMWTRPIYPLAINLFQFLFSLSAEQSAITVSFIASILAIPLSYFFISSTFKSTLAGVFAALLTTISFNHIVWSGFIYTEALAIFLMLSFLSLLFTTIHKKSVLADAKELGSGVLLALAIFCRYEYLLLVIPFFFFIFSSDSKTKRIKLINILLGFLLISTILITQLFPWQDFIRIGFVQFREVLLIAVFLLLIILLGAFIFSKIKMFDSDIFITRFNRFLIGIIWIIASLILLQQLFSNLNIFNQFFSAIRSFFVFDFLLGLTTLGGYTPMLKQKHYHSFAYFSLGSIFLLWPIYQFINPEMQRYWLHMFPFLLIPSCYFLCSTFQQFSFKSNYAKYVALILLFLLVSQLYLSFKGIRDWDNGDWFHMSYEEKAAKQVFATTANLSDETFYLTSFPESYYFFLQRSTYSITDHQPFIFIDERFDNRELIIVEDMGMRDIFPVFSHFLKTHFQNKKIQEFYIGEHYHFADRIIQENQPVILYLTTVGELRNHIKNP